MQINVPNPSILWRMVCFNAPWSFRKGISSKVVIGAGISPPWTEMCIRLRNSLISSSLLNDRYFPQTYVFSFGSTDSLSFNSFSWSSKSIDALRSRMIKWTNHPINYPDVRAFYFFCPAHRLCTIIMAKNIHTVNYCNWRSRSKKQHLKPILKTLSYPLHSLCITLRRWNSYSLFWRVSFRFPSNP